MLSMRAGLHADKARDAAYQLELDGEPYALRVRDGAVVQAGRGTVAGPDATARTEPVTLVRVLRRTLGPEEAITRGGLTLERPHRALERFVEAFAWSG